MNSKTTRLSLWKKSLFAMPTNSSRKRIWTRLARKKRLSSQWRNSARNRQEESKRWKRSLDEITAQKCRFSGTRNRISQAHKQQDSPKRRQTSKPGWRLSLTWTSEYADSRRSDGLSSPPQDGFRRRRAARHRRPGHLFSSAPPTCRPR